MRTYLFRGALLCAVVFAQIGATPQASIHRVDIGGRQLNLVCTGHGSPTVVLEAGMLADSTAWRRVQPAIAKTTRVCSYDRAGMGFSDATRGARDALAIVADLHALLEKSGERGPYVLAGWSSGGLYTRLYQYRYPKDVAGLVEIDPDTEFFTGAEYLRLVQETTLKPPDWARQQIANWLAQMDNCAANIQRRTCTFFKSRAQYLRANGCLTHAPNECALEEARATQLSQPSLWRAVAAEAHASLSDPAEVRAAARPYADLPLIVLTDSEDGDVDPHDPAFPVAVQRAGWARKSAAHQRLARLSRGGAHFTVPNTTHAILLDEPSAVISAIDEVVDAARFRARCSFRGVARRGSHVAATQEDSIQCNAR